MNYAPPDRIVLAFDPGPCGNLALGRAAQLAEKWNADLISLTAVDPASATDPSSAWEQTLNTVRQAIDSTLGERKIKVTAQVACNGDSVCAIRTLASDAGSTLVVTGAEQSDTPGQRSPLSMVESLASSLNQPLLVVRSPSEKIYQRIVVATDFSVISAYAWKIAQGLFPDRTIDLFHAREIELDDLLGDNPYERVASNAEHRKRIDLLAAGNASQHRQPVPVVMHGAAEEVLDRFVARHEIDLVVIGAGGKGGINKLLLGDTASRLLGRLSCDVLVVTAPSIHGR